MITKALITGINGTIGSALKTQLEKIGVEVVGWNRNEVSITNYSEMLDFVSRVQPNVIFHLAVASTLTGKENETWLVNYEWSSELAWISRILNIKFIFTSSVMVFSDHAKGPFSIYSEPDAEQGYGFEKRMAEKRVHFQNPQSVILRLGWQIGKSGGSNNMLDFFEKKQNELGKVEASSKWLPACSFLNDTIDILIDSVNYEPDVYMVDSNKRWNFFEIASALNLLHNNRWTIQETNSFEFDQRMFDDRIKIKPLNYYLKNL